MENINDDLDQLFQTHENRIKTELYNMCRTFESYTQSQDANVMTNFFDYLSYRLVATCKKMEVDFLAKMTDQPDVPLKSFDSGISEVPKTPTSPHDAINTVKEENDDKKSLHGDWEMDLLKIVEDNDSDNNEKKAIDTTDKTLAHVDADAARDSTEINNSNEPVEQDTSGCSSVTVETVSNTNIDDIPQQNVKEVTKRSHDFDEENVKKLKTNDDADATQMLPEKTEQNEELEEGEVIESTKPKNTDPNVYLTNPSYRFKCVLCVDLATNLVDHYKMNHSESEVYVSRPSPTVAVKIRRRTEEFNFIPSSSQISATCFFCEVPRRMSFGEWKQHFQYHTGENDTVDDGQQLFGYMCKLCNYVQIEQNNLKLHLTTEHETFDDEIVNCCEEIVLLPDLTPLTPHKAMDLMYVDDARRYMCGIGWCDHQSKDIFDFRLHLKESHANTKEPFGCLHCNHLIHPKDSSYFDELAGHLTLHGDDWFSCSYCELYFATERNAIAHTIFKHRSEKVVYRHQYRKDLATNTEIKERQIMLQCNICDTVFYTIENGMVHFKNAHNSMDNRFSINTLTKCTASGLTTCTQYCRNDEFKQFVEKLILENE